MIEPKFIDTSLNNLAPILGGSCYEDDILVASINKYNNDITNNKFIAQRVPFQLNYGLFLLVLNGSMSISLDYKEIEISKNQWICLFPNNVLSLGKMSDDFFGLVTITSKRFVENAISTNKTLPAAFTGQLKPQHSPILLSEVETQVLREGTQRIVYYINSQNLFKKELLTISFLAYLLELANIIFSRTSVSEVTYSISRKEMLTQKFLHLVRINAKREHSLGFYANNLCISTKYLSLVVRSATGKTPKDWIADHLIVEAKILFRKPGITIQGIADELGFSDQASFTKFFKNQTGMTPKRFWLTQ